MSGMTRRHARAPLAARIAIGAAAVVLCGIGVAAGINLYALDAYNQATQSLNQNLKSADNPNTDLNTLLVQQSQTDSQFQTADAPAAVLLPSIAHSIATNARISKTLSDRIRQAIAAQQGQSSSSNGTGQGNIGSNAAAGSTPTGGLTQKQRQQVQQLLKSNQAAQQPNTSSTNTPSPTPSNSTVKPW